MSKAMTRSIYSEQNKKLIRIHLSKVYLVIISYIKPSHTANNVSHFSFMGLILLRRRVFLGAAMGSFRALFVALLVTAVAFDKGFVDAKFSKSMYFNWGASHSSILGNGDDLELVLDSTSGKYDLLMFLHITLCLAIIICPKYFIIF